MDLFEKSWMNTATEKMRWAEARQNQIATNIANADSPGFVGRDVVSFEEHLANSLRDPFASVDSEEANSSWGGSFDGNQIVLEEQALLASETEGQHRMAGELYKKAHGMIGLAISTK